MALLSKSSGFWEKMGRRVFDALIPRKDREIAGVG